MNRPTIMDRLSGWVRAYPEVAFRGLSGDPIERTGDYDTRENRDLVTRAGISMGRHMIEHAIKPALAAMEKMVTRIAELEAENAELRDRAAELEAQNSEIRDRELALARASILTIRAKLPRDDRLKISPKMDTARVWSELVDEIGRVIDERDALRKERGG